MANPSGPATKARTQTQGVRQRKRTRGPGKDPKVSPEQKKLMNLILKNQPRAVREAFKVGLRSTDLRFLSGTIWAEFIKLNLLEAEGKIDAKTATVNKARFFDYLRRIAAELNEGPALPDTITIELETPPGLSMATDLPETE